MDGRQMDLGSRARAERQGKWLVSRHQLMSKVFITRPLVAPIKSHPKGHPLQDILKLFVFGHHRHPASRREFKGRERRLRLFSPGKLLLH